VAGDPNHEVHAARILGRLTFWGAILAAVIGGIFLLVNAWLNKPAVADKAPPKADLTLKAKVIQQPVNSKFRTDPAQNIEREEKQRAFEEATFQFTVTNKGKNPVKVERVQFVPHSVAADPFNGSTLLSISLIDHKDDTPVWLKNPKPNQAVPIPVSLTVPPYGAKDFRVWFKSTDTPDCGYLRVSGTLVLIYEGGELVGDPITVIVDSESKRHYGK